MLWRRALSVPIGKLMSAGNAVLIAFVNERSDAVFQGYDLGTGRIRWQATVEGGLSVADVIQFGRYAVYVHGTSGAGSTCEMVGYEIESGRKTFQITWACYVAGVKRAVIYVPSELPGTVEDYHPLSLMHWPLSSGSPKKC